MGRQGASLRVLLWVVGRQVVPSSVVYSYAGLPSVWGPWFCKCYSSHPSPHYWGPQLYSYSFCRPSRSDLGFGFPLALHSGHGYSFLWPLSWLLVVGRQLPLLFSFFAIVSASATVGQYLSCGSPLLQLFADWAVPVSPCLCSLSKQVQGFLAFAIQLVIHFSKQLEALQLSVAWCATAYCCHHSVVPVTAALATFLSIAMAAHCVTILTCFTKSRQDKTIQENTFIGPNGPASREAAQDCILVGLTSKPTAFLYREEIFQQSQEITSEGLCLHELWHCLLCTSPSGLSACSPQKVYSLSDLGGSNCRDF